MGFWAWLLGKNKKVEEAPKTENAAPKVEPKKEVAYPRPKYTKIQRTKETKDYVSSIVKKAESKDTAPKPYRESVDQNSVEKFVDKIQGRR